MKGININETQASQNRFVSGRNGIVGTGLIIILTAAFTFAQSPAVEVLSPNSGAEFRVGSTLTVQWALRNQTRPDGGVAILFSPDQGMSWLYLSQKTMQNGDTAVYRDSVGTFSWQIVDSVRMYGAVYVQIASSQCLIKVEAPYDDSFVPGTSNIFSISPSTRVVQSGRNEIVNHRPARGIRRVNGLIKTGDFGIIRLDGRRMPASIERPGKGFKH